MKQNNTAFGLSVAVIFAITVIAISEIPNAMEKSDANDQPDLVATLAAEGSTDAQGKALFWLNDDAFELRYKIELNRVNIGSVGDEGTGYDKNSGKGLEYYVT